MILSIAAKVAVVAAVVAVLAIGAVLAFGVLRLVGEEHKQNCIDEAQARFPAIGLAKNDPFANQAGGPTRVTNVDERNAALDDCEATIF